MAIQLGQGQTEARSHELSLYLPHRYQGPNSSDHSLLFFIAYEQGTGLELEQVGLELALVWDGGIVGSGFYPQQGHNTSSSLVVSNSHTWV